MVSLFLNKCTNRPPWGQSVSDHQLLVCDSAPTRCRSTTTTTTRSAKDSRREKGESDSGNSRRGREFSSCRRSDISWFFMAPMTRASLNLQPFVSCQVERHRALQQRIELEQQALFGAPGPTGLAAGPPAGPAPGPAPAPTGESLSQMSFFSSGPPQDFLQTCPVSRPPQQNQSQTGSQRAGAHQGYPEGAPTPGALLASGLRPRTGAELSLGLPESRSSPRFLATEGQACLSPSSPLPCLAGEPSSLLKRDGEDTGSGTPLSSHSDDVTASSTPALLDSSCSGPTQAPPSVTLPQVKVSHHITITVESRNLPGPMFTCAICTVSSEGARGGRSL